MTIVFADGVLNTQQSLAIQNPEVKSLVESLSAGDIKLDKRFVYYLLGATGLCVVPLMGGFNSTYYGFRITLLEPDEQKFTHNLEVLKTAVINYLAS